jgi:DNA-binding IclR family transcriptional regulator
MTTARDRPPEEAAEDTSFARGLRLLLTVADRGEVRADELSALLEMPISTVYRYLRTLAEFGFVDRQGGQFRLGPKLLIGTGANVSSERLIRYADPVLRMLVAQTGESAAVIRRVGHSAICLHQVESDAALRVTIEPGSMLPLTRGAPGHALLAFAPGEILDEILLESQPRPIAHDQSEAALRASLADVARTGISVSEDEPFEGSVALAAPVFREDGIVGAIVLIGPASRCDADWRARSSRLLLAAARTVNAGLADDRTA